MNHADKHNILYPLQHGFRRHRSCETQLLEFIDDVTLNLENSHQTDVLIMDFSKAFDKVSHNLLALKLKHYGIQGKTNKWILSFLSNRTKAVRHPRRYYIRICRRPVRCAPRFCPGTQPVFVLYK